MEKQKQAIYVVVDREENEIARISLPAKEVNQTIHTFLWNVGAEFLAQLNNIQIIQLHRAVGSHKLTIRQDFGKLQWDGDGFQCEWETGRAALLLHDANRLVDCVLDELMSRNLGMRGEL